MNQIPYKSVVKLLEVKYVLPRDMIFRGVADARPTCHTVSRPRSSY